MIERLSPGERVGDGVDDEILAAQVSAAIPFIHYALEGLISPDQISRKPSNDPDHWLAARNCGPASKALNVFLSREGYKANLLSDIYGTHMLLEVDRDGDKVWIDPTALQFLSKYNIGAEIDSLKLDGRDDNLGQMLPPERILMFRPEDSQNVAEWMANVVRRYWQTKTTARYAIGQMQRYSTIPLGKYGSTETSVPYHRVETNFAQIYDPNNFMPWDGYVLYDYEKVYDSWINNEPAIDANKSSRSRWM